MQQDTTERLAGGLVHSPELTGLRSRAARAREWARGAVSAVWGALVGDVEKDLNPIDIKNYAKYLRNADL